MPQKTCRDCDTVQLTQGKRNRDQRVKLLYVIRDIYFSLCEKIKYYALDGNIKKNTTVHIYDEVYNIGQKTHDLNPFFATRVDYLHAPGL